MKKRWLPTSWVMTHQQPTTSYQWQWKCGCSLTSCPGRDYKNETYLLICQSNLYCCRPSSVIRGVGPKLDSLDLTRRKVVMKHAGHSPHYLLKCNTNALCPLMTPNYLARKCDRSNYSHFGLHVLENLDKNKSSCIVLWLHIFSGQLTLFRYRLNHFTVYAGSKRRTWLSVSLVLCAVFSLSFCRRHRQCRPTGVFRISRTASANSIPAC